MNKNFKKLYGDIANDKNCTIMDVLQEDGSISINKTVDSSYKAVIEIHNCISNPFYFLDKLKIKKENDIVTMPINLSGFMAVKMISGAKKTNIIVDHPLGTNVNELLLGYVLHKLLFTDEYVIINSSKDIHYCTDIINVLYANMPSYLGIKSLNSIFSRILTNVYDKDTLESILEDSEKKVGLLVYMESNTIPPSKFFLGTKIPTIVSNSGGDSRNIKYRFYKDHNGYGFKIINYDVKLLGISNDKLNEIYKIEMKFDHERFMQEMFLMYDDMTDEEAQKLEDEFNK